MGLTLHAALKLVDEPVIIAQLLGATQMVSKDIAVHYYGRSMCRLTVIHGKVMESHNIMAVQRGTCI